jgi:hypothetical protein
MRFTECALYRAARTTDGQGGWTSAYADGTPLFGIAQAHGDRTEFLCRALEDIRPEDVLEIAGRFYRVLGRTGLPRAGLRSHPLEAVERPFVPPAATTATPATTTTSP